MGNVNGVAKLPYGLTDDRTPPRREIVRKSNPTVRYKGQL